MRSRSTLTVWSAPAGDAQTLAPARDPGNFQPGGGHLTGQASRSATNSRALLLAASWKNTPTSFSPGPPPARSDNERKIRNGTAFTVATCATAVNQGGIAGRARTVELGSSWCALRASIGVGTLGVKQVNEPAIPSTRRDGPPASAAALARPRFSYVRSVPLPRFL
jgi:hypothetical protein